MEKFWYCVKHHAVEEQDGCGPIDRLGPFDTREEAAQALDLAERRNQEWEEGED